ncbi:Endonuclease 2 [Zea mays]|uniref:Aspergillus nuclease S1 n=1 Tax=Zea mays TaxID=4577 RepID=A0A317YBY8_MAIZE|nr:Endonuclease 2 [Zea mays]
MKQGEANGYFVICGFCGILFSYAGNNLSSLCSWADDVKFRGLQEQGRCQGPMRRECHQQLYLLAPHLREIFSPRIADNLTQMLLFLSHFIRDIHKPLHVGFTSNKGGNTVDFHWYARKTVLHHVWDASIIQPTEDDFYGDRVAGYIDTLKKT